MGAPLDDLTDPGTTLLTTESSRQVRERLFATAFFGTLAILFSLVVYTGVEPVDLPGLLAVAFVAFAVALFAPLMFLFLPLGHWRIDAEGIAFQPCHGRPRSLRWAEVERVRWTRTEAILRGARTSIRLPWHLLPADDRVAARGRIAKLLADDFDLRLPERPRPAPLTRADLPRAIARWAGLVGLAVGLTAIWAVGMVALVVIGERHRGSDLARGIVATAGMLWMAAIFLGPQFLLLRKMRTEHRLRLPDWRVRRSKSLPEL